MLKGFLLALQFLTVLPVGKGHSPTGDELRRSMAFFPLVGALQGAVLVAADHFLSGLLPFSLVNALLITLLILTNGGLHMDGLADTVDGIAGGSTPDERLGIMRSGSTGPMGVTAIVLALLIKFFSLEGLPGERAAYLLLFPIVGRWAMVPMGYFSTYARKEGGLGEAFTSQSFSTLLAATIITAAASAYFLGLASLIVLFALGVLTYGAAAFFKGKLGGVTGDVFGFQSEVSELAFLLLALSFL